MSVASRSAGWDRWGGSPSAGSGPSFATADTPVGPRVEIYVDEAWIDISPDVRSSDKITTTGGRPDEASRIQQNTCRFTLNNRDGLYSPRNPLSPLYGKIGRNTAVRVSVDQEGTQRFRFHGEIVSWPVGWDLTGNDVWVKIEAAGILRRLNQGNSPLHSTLYRGLVRETNNPVIAYWPMEDGAESTFLASAISGGPNMTISGTPTLSSFDSFACSEPIPVMSNGSVTGKLPPYTVTGTNQVRFLLSIPVGGETNGKVLCRLNATGTGHLWDLYYSTAGGGTIGVIVYDADNVVIQDSGASAFDGIDGLLVRVSFELTQSGADVSVNMSVLYPTYLLNVTVLFNSVTVSKIGSITLTPGKGSGSTAMGHLSMQTQTSSSFDLFGQTKAYKGESPSTRIARLCAEEGISFVSITNGQTGNTAAIMGPQRAKTLVDLLQECVDSDLGVLYEPRDRLGLEYRTRLSLYNRSAVMTLSYTSSDLLEVHTPVDDDQLSRNDITVKRDQGSFARAVLESGPLSVLPPPNGIGTYDDAPTISLNDDSLLLDQANWRLHVGTVDEPRYPTATVHLKRSSFTASYDLTASALLIKPGDRYLITDSPIWLPPGDISLILNSYTEWFDQFEHVITFNGAPESPYRVAKLDDETLGRCDTDGSVLTSAIDSSTGTIQVTTTSGPLWTTDVAEFPFLVMVGGECLNVTAISGASSPQTFTVDRATNGITKAHPAGEDLRLLQPMIIAL